MARQNITTTARQLTLATDALAALTRIWIAHDNLNSGEFSYGQKLTPRPAGILEQFQ